MLNPLAGMGGEGERRRGEARLRRLELASPLHPKADKTETPQ